ncbi:MAG TPA: dihydrofolate reductase family protein [Methylomirabilota bacterium]|nr:dihydrofolate reductase family protein [Methylomirabilota bacterium]
MNLLPPLTPKLRSGLPFVYLNIATTVDGKLAPANRDFTPFSSNHDQELLLELRTRCDAVMAGARTVDSVPVNLGPGGKKYREMRIRNGLTENNLRIVVSGSGTLNPRAEIFRHKFSPIIVLVAQRAGITRITRLKELGAIVKVCGEKEIDFSYALRWLRKDWNVTRLLCEGGGEINSALFRHDLVNEVYLTLCPTVFGGRSAPTMADGIGATKLADATRVKLKTQQQIGKELFLVYSVFNRQDTEYKK